MARPGDTGGDDWDERKTPANGRRAEPSGFEKPFEEESEEGYEEPYEESGEESYEEEPYEEEPYEEPFEEESEEGYEEPYEESEEESYEEGAYEEPYAEEPYEEGPYAEGPYAEGPYAEEPYEESYEEELFEEDGEAPAEEEPSARPWWRFYESWFGARRRGHAEKRALADDGAPDDDDAPDDDAPAERKPRSRWAQPWFWPYWGFMAVHRWRERMYVDYPNGYKLVRNLFLAAVVCVITGYTLLYGGEKAYNLLLAPVNTENPAYVELTIPSGTSVSGIGGLLELNHLVRSRLIFKLAVNFFDNAGNMKAGTYVLNQAMTMNDIVDVLSQGNEVTTAVVQFTIPEGRSCEQIAEILLTAGLLEGDASAFLETCRTGAGLEDYAFVAESIKKSDGQRRYVLEGYLAPDTYLVYEDATPETILRKLLTQHQVVMSYDFEIRAEELNMTTDEIITLASMIEKEAKTNDFYYVSAVFHNRLRTGMALGSDVTVQYALQTDALLLSNAQTQTDSPYNTYLHTGLPTGPITNPGRAAIMAALYPDEVMLEEGYLYFCLTDPATGALAFAKTQEEHDANVEKYRPLWEAFEQKRKETQ